MFTNKLWFSCGLAFCLLLNPVLAFSEGHHSESATFKKTELTENIWMLQGKGGNIAVLTGEQGIFLVDDDYKEMSSALKSELAKFGGLDKLTYIINTHWHGDHTQGNMALGTHAPIIAHDNVRARLLTTQEVKLFNMVSKPYPEIALPSITYSSAMNIYLNGEDIKIVHYPDGHTDGDSIVFFQKANVVHMGDHFFSGFFPFVDVDSGGNVLTMAKNIQEALSEINDQTQIIPGHGPLSNKDDLIQFHDMLVGTSKEVEVMQQQGMTLEQIKTKGLSSRWDSWTDGFLSTSQWIGILYNSLNKKTD